MLRKPARIGAWALIALVGVFFARDRVQNSRALRANRGGMAAYPSWDTTQLRPIENAAPRWRSSTAWRIAGEPLQDIPLPRDSTGVGGTRITSLVRLSNGVVALATRRGSVTLYDSSGRSRTTLESLVPAAGTKLLGNCRANLLLVFNRAQSRIDEYTLAGEHVGSFSLRVFASGAPPSTVACSTDGRIAVMSAPTYYAPVPEGHLRTVVSLALISSRGVVQLQIPEFPASDEVRIGNTIAPLPFGKRTIFAAGTNRLFVGTGDRYEILAYGPDSRLAGVWRRHVTPQRLTDAAVTRFVDATIAAIPDAPSRLQYTRIYGEMPFPSYLPAYRTFLTDADGNLWVEKYEVDRSVPQCWDVLEPTGAYLGEVCMPPGFAAWQVGQDWILGSTRNAAGMEHVNLYAILKDTLSTA